MPNINAYNNGEDLINKIDSLVTDQLLPSQLELQSATDNSHEDIDISDVTESEEGNEIEGDEAAERLEEVG